MEISKVEKIRAGFKLRKVISKKFYFHVEQSLTSNAWKPILLEYKSDRPELEFLYEVVFTRYADEMPNYERLNLEPSKKNRINKWSEGICA